MTPNPFSTVPRPLAYKGFMPRSAAPRTAVSLSFSPSTGTRNQAQECVTFLLPKMIFLSNQFWSTVVEACSVDFRWVVRPCKLRWFLIASSSRGRNDSLSPDALAPWCSTFQIKLGVQLLTPHPIDSLSSRWLGSVFLGSQPALELGTPPEMPSL